MTVEEVFETGLSILFQEPEINSGESGSKFQLKFDPLPRIEITVPDVDKKNVKLFAHHLWRASIYMSRILVNGFYDVDVRGKKVLEMGAGCGLPSIVAHLLGAAVTSSDYPDPTLLAHLKKNVGKDIQVIGHVWGQEDGLNDSFDLILLADTLWMTDQHFNLLHSCQRFLKPNGQVLLVAGLHTGQEVLDCFLEKAATLFRVEVIAAVQVPIGNGFFENEEWKRVDQVDNRLEHRKRFLWVYRLQFKVPGDL